MVLVLALGLFAAGHFFYIMSCFLSYLLCLVGPVSYCDHLVREREEAGVGCFPFLLV